MFENQADDSEAKNKYFIEGEEELYEDENETKIDRRANSKMIHGAARNIKYWYSYSFFIYLILKLISYV